MMNKTKGSLWASFVIVCICNNITQAQIKLTGKDDPNSEWDLYMKGYVQMDAMLDFQEIQSKDGFAVPAITLPQQNSMSSSFSIKQSQIGLGVKQKNSDENLSVYLEIDFLGPNGTTAPRFRKGYITWRKFMVGQNWSNFSDVDIFPNIFDFAGPNGTMFIRSMQVRYTTNLSKKEQLSLSLEDPNTVSVTLPNSPADWKQKAIIPAFTTVYRYGNERDYFKAGGILAPISYEIKNDVQDKYNTHTTLGFGGMVSGRLYSNTLNNFRFQSSYGKGYATNNIVLNGGHYDAIPNVEKNTLETVSLLNLVGIYEHWWSPKWSSVIFYSYSQVGNKNFMPENMAKNFQNAGLNLVFQPYKKLRVGVEGNYGSFKNFANKKAEAFRLQFSTSLAF
ncbi:DcaP family trimeric outer membrane transporter [Chryseobacterium sp. ERMR1:04]|uniref:DcaP family trimeric outer membrane transporter n=1 Tax=Chryseobacterium sp. ERMR1:04 TaxID=1705393 RepID=UPI0006C8DF73|nr:DcaP family trimeric outer membrane transporter [Chryseobacterium sp. ERMR1:04]KPH14870.1 hypothetical protein AMQ68_05450 [Chryseobacterium sp. ERMR1:04]